MYGDLKNKFSVVLIWLSVLGVCLSPWLALVASVLTTIKWYSISNSILMGLLGFITGGAATLLIAGVFLAIAGSVVYYLEYREE